MKKKISFIVNPIAGGIRKETFPSLIGKYVDRNQFETEINFTRSGAHNQELAKQAVEEKKDMIIAVGGDGTISNIAKYVAGSDSAFGMVPMGSGNGLARHLGIPLEPKQALKLINKQKVIRIDTGQANDEFFINVAGVGFDAHVCWMFAHAPKRGFWSYARITLREFAAYKAHDYEMIIDGKTVNEPAFLICVANGSQYGNNAYIAPTADLSSGEFEISVLKPFSITDMPFIGYHLFSKKFGNSKYVSSYKGKHIIIRRREAEVVNIDGEPVMMEKDLDIRILPGSLKVIVP